MQFLWSVHPFIDSFCRFPVRDASAQRHRGDEATDFRYESAPFILVADAESPAPIFFFMIENPFQQAALANRPPLYPGQCGHMQVKKSLEFRRFKRNLWFVTGRFAIRMQRESLDRRIENIFPHGPIGLDRTDPVGLRIEQIAEIGFPFVEGDPPTGSLTSQHDDPESRSLALLAFDQPIQFIKKTATYFRVIQHNEGILLLRKQLPQT